MNLAIAWLAFAAQDPGVLEEGAADPIVMNAAADDEVESRRWAAEQLPTKGGTRALPLLVLLVQGDESRIVRLEAALSLGKLADARAASALWTCYERDADEAVRLACRRSLGLADAQAAEEEPAIATVAKTPPRRLVGPRWKNVVFANPYNLRSRMLSVGWERVFGPRVSLAVVPSFQYDASESDAGGAGSIEVRTIAGGVYVQPHVYFDAALRGAYVAPFVAAMWGSIDQKIDFAGMATEMDVSFSSRGVGLLGGWAWQWDRVNLKIGVGAQYFDVKMDLDMPNPDPTVPPLSLSLSGLGFAGDIKLGVAF